MLTLLWLVAALGLFALAVRARDDRSFLLSCGFGVLGAIFYTNYHSQV